MNFAFIRKRSKNYIVYLEYKDPETKKKIQKNMGSYDKKRDASKRLTELKDNIYNNDLLLPNAMTLEVFLKDFLELLLAFPQFYLSLDLDFKKLCRASSHGLCPPINQKTISNHGKEKRFKADHQLRLQRFVRRGCSSITVWNS